MTFGSNATIDRGDANVLSESADALRNSGGFAEAIEPYDEALAINLNNFAVLNTGPGSVGIVPISVLLNIDSRTHTRD
jgi:tetratricopeptide (TPR) repeat protein